MESLASVKTQSWLSWFLRGITILIFLILLARIFELQIIKGNYFRMLAEENRIRHIRIQAPRGKILARGGEVLVGNIQVKSQKTDNDWIRDYPLGSAFGHVGGYLGEVSPYEVGKIGPKCPEKGPRGLGDLIGRGGLEEMYDCRLRGVDGEKLIEVDSKGKLVRILGTKEPSTGDDLRTNIDFKLQRQVAKVMGNRKGAIIVSDPEGSILALFSSPSFDPKQIKEALKNPDLPFFNRAISGKFPPGSVFKPVVAIAALEEGKINKDYTYDDPGVIKVDKFSYKNWYFTQYGKLEGKIDLIRAITRSTDTFFYKLGEMVGADTLANWANKFGLGETTGIDLPAEAAGLIPTPSWKEKFKGERWFLGNTYHMAIGQGDLLLTPLEVNTMTSILASGGKLCSPKIAEKTHCRNFNLGKENLELVKKGMEGACSSGGTAFPFFDFTPKVACKTGTAETTDYTQPHAWFTVYGPSEMFDGGPEIVVTVIIEHGGEGSYVAAPIARKIFDYWFSSENKP